MIVIEVEWWLIWLWMMIVLEGKLVSFIDICIFYTLTNFHLFSGCYGHNHRVYSWKPVVLVYRSQVGIGFPSILLRPPPRRPGYHEIWKVRVLKYYEKWRWDYHTPDFGFNIERHLDALHAVGLLGSKLVNLSNDWVLCELNSSLTCSKHLQPRLWRSFVSILLPVTLETIPVANFTRFSKLLTLERMFLAILGPRLF